MLVSYNTMGWTKNQGPEIVTILSKLTAVEDRGKIVHHLTVVPRKMLNLQSVILEPPNEQGWDPKTIVAARGLNDRVEGHKRNTCCLRASGVLRRK
jgi:hypothetical protein